METIEMLMLARSAERIVALLLGGAAIYLAFKLFLNLPNVNSIDDNFKFKTYFSYHIIKIGMGAMFMMFGATIVLFSIFKAPKYIDKTGHIEYTGMNSQLEHSHTSETLIDPSLFMDYFAILNDIPEKLMADIDPIERNRIETTISRTKLNLMLAIWDEDLWGDPIAFNNWIVRGENFPYPKLVDTTAIHFYNHTKNPKL